MGWAGLRCQVLAWAGVSLSTMQGQTREAGINQTTFGGSRKLWGRRELVFVISEVKEVQG